MLDHFGGAFERADPRNSGDVFAVPFFPELKFLVGVEALIDGELRMHAPRLSIELTVDLPCVC